MQDKLFHVLYFVAEYIKNNLRELFLVVGVVYVISKKAYDLLVFIAILVFVWFIFNVGTSVDILLSIKEWVIGG